MSKIVKTIFLIMAGAIFLAVALMALRMVFGIPMMFGLRMGESLSGLVVLGLVLLSPLIIFSMFKGRDGGNSESPFVDNEPQQIQELYQRMEKLTDRLESLETILMDRIKKS